MPVIRAVVRCDELGLDVLNITNNPILINVQHVYVGRPKGRKEVYRSYQPYPPSCLAAPTPINTGHLRHRSTVVGLETGLGFNHALAVAMRRLT